MELLSRVKMSYEGAISSLGKMRDEDGTVDRVADPPPEMWPILAALKYKCEVENIELVSVFEEGGDTHFGNMKTHKFFSVLKDNFQRYNFGVDVLDAIMNHYGCGYRDPRGRYENIAWKDFCEDVGYSKEKAFEIDQKASNVAEIFATTRGADISFSSLQDVNDIVSDELEYIAGKGGTNDSFVLSVNKFDAGTLMKASKAENEAAIAAGIDLRMVQGDGGLQEKARVLQHADDCVK